MDLKSLISLLLFQLFVVNGDQQVKRDNSSESISKFDLTSNQRVVNGVPALINEFPYAVFIYIDLGSSGEVCTGSLISDSVVVTAAHCLLKDLKEPYSPSKFLVSAGSIKSIDTNTNRFKVKATYSHPKFNKNSLANDIGLLVLSSPVPSSIATPVSIYDDVVGDGMNVTAAGWGVTSNNANASASKVLNKVPLIVSSSSTCKTLNPFWKNNNDYSICTVNVKNQDTCYGDSGGPLTYIEDGAHLLVGLTSMGNAPGDDTTSSLCGVNGGAAYYTHVFYFIDWISQTTGIKKEDLLDKTSRSNLQPQTSAATRKGSQVFLPISFSLLFIAFTLLLFM
ncbi:Chymotrypsin B [Zancudomyces culisetae]|uniref:Chymotrypsin B n=1 Tax=Zancudomyces culisetae TaxID=1213189 RepID=A0A1R1PSE1_ZANCU|nr:Chymotrypsin B [Zancudomyces culisetae]|eukprot:OMH83906.1 Chymotrypsin B [Zancudomyces culisetae]